jgi:hypothetical protein
MHDLHIQPDLLLGRHVKDHRGSKYQIVAVWMEEPTDSAHRPSLVALVIRDDGVAYKQYLPDMDLEFQPLQEGA